MKFFKKGQGLSLNVIIIAAIALIVLIVLVFILTGRMQIFGKGLNDCESKGGECDSRTNCKALKGNVEIPGTECGDVDSTRVCCLKVIG